MARKAANSSTDKINKVTGTVIFISVKVIVYIIVALVFYYGITGAYQLGLNLFSKRTMTSAPGIEMRISVDEKDSVMDIGRTLEKMGLIHDAYAFVFQKYFYEVDIGPGVYTLNTAMTVKEALEAMDVDNQEEETEE
ncbi:MAG: endolytic transglycosylase MltG [Lachnospiraceae bacterium]|jgi:cell division protein YceG involved in septum cleavage|nr:endolytic transglycosylase MltG [Lachnospiraceae bacterium]